MERQLKLWCVRAQNSAYTAHFHQGGFTAIDYDIAERLPEVALKSQIADLYLKYNAELHSPLATNQHIEQIMRFVFDIEVGDYILMPSSDPDLLYFGVVLDEPYLFISEPKDSCPLRHRRAVEWHPYPVSRAGFSAAFQQTLKSSQAVFGMKHAAEFFSKTGIVASAIPKDDFPTDPGKLVLLRLMELDDSEFRLLIEELLAAIGFEECQLISAGTDRAIILTAHLSILNIFRSQLYIQLRRGKISEQVSANAILQLRATIPLHAHGVFITMGEFRKEAIAVANEQGFPRIGLITGAYLVDLLCEYWPHLPSVFHEKLGLKHGLIQMQHYP